MNIDFKMQIMILLIAWGVIAIITFITQSRVLIALMSIVLLFEIYSYYWAMEGWKRSNNGWKATIKFLEEVKNSLKK